MSGVVTLRVSMRAHSPGCRLVVLQKLAPYVRASRTADEDRIHDARSAVDDIERRRETELGFTRGVNSGIFVGHPTGVDGVHVNAIFHVVRRARARHHVERGFRHVRVRMLVCLGGAVELALSLSAACCCFVGLYTWDS